MLECIYLTVDDVVLLHADGIEEHGGDPNLRDRGLLESAVAQPRAGFGGEEFHPSLADKAAAYLYYIAKAHPFVDGNKRVAARAALTLLAINGYELSADTDRLYELVISVVEGRCGLSDASAYFDERMSEQ